MAKALASWLQKNLKSAQAIQPPAATPTPIGGTPTPPAPVQPKPRNPKAPLPATLTGCKVTFDGHNAIISHGGSPDIHLVLTSEQQAVVHAQLSKKTWGQGNANSTDPDGSTQQFVQDGGMPTPGQDDQNDQNVQWPTPPA